MPQPIYSTEDIRRIEKIAGDVALMERAGNAAAQMAMRLMPEDSKDILVVAGPGNNGGDARIAARQLSESYYRVSVATRVEEIATDKKWGLVIDGLFGIGLARDVAGDYAALIDYMNQCRARVLALDVPSGINADTGRVLGRAVRATHTLTFIALKPGLLTLHGPDHCGEITVTDLGLDTADLARPSAWLAAPELFSTVLKKRPREFHKGLAGSLAILGGASGMVGAALLAGRSALKLGAGRVYVGLLAQQTPPVDAGALELMLRHPDDALGEELDALVVGPGLGTSERAETLVGAALASDIPCVIDADALNVIAANPDLRRACARRRADTLATPHPGEAARLLGVKTADVQADRVAAAKTLARELNAHVVLKGNGSIMVARDGHWFVNGSGNPGMASAGMGDVLAGIFGALLAQRYSGEATLVLGVHLAGAAADALVRSGHGPVGLVAGELMDPARKIWNSWLRE